jgi:D-arabinitol dehydrogenase (NADP+)
MNAVVYEGPGVFSIKEVPDPEVRPHQVLVRVRMCGVCKTDVHIHSGKFISSFPLIPGHEFCGEILEVGRDVQGFRVGDRVVADNTELCGYCYYCRRDQPLYCENFYSLGCNGPGGFAEYVAVNHDKVFHITPELSYREAAFAEPTACAVHGMDRLNINPGDDVLQFGAGPTGLVLAQLIKVCGAASLVVASPTRNKLDLAKKLGADQVVQVQKKRSDACDAEIMRNYPKGFDVVVDATGDPAVTENAPRYAKHGGRILVYGVCDEDDRIKLSPYDIFKRELTVLGSFAQTHCFDRALKYLESRVVDVRDLVTNVYRLDDYATALSAVMGDRNVVKILIEP